MTLDLQRVADAMRARGAPPAKQVSGWSVDTRTLAPGDVYFALQGPNHDGHNFIRDAVEAGASAVVAQRSTGAPVELLVDDSLRALQDLAVWARRQWGGEVIGVTGSAGKTTTKDAIAHLLSVAMPTGKTVGNLNNHVGVPLSILRLPEKSRAAVLEMGMNHAGEIRDLAALAKPRVGVVTNVGYAHVEFFDSIEGVAAAKRELIEGLPADGVAVLNADDPLVSQFRFRHRGRSILFGFSESAEVRAQTLVTTNGRTRFRALGATFETTLTGRHSILNLLAAISVAQVYGIAAGRLGEAVRSFTAGKMRGERSEHNGVSIIDDCYNSNPEAAKSMIDVLRATPAQRRIAVLGEMLELGAQSARLHRQLGEHAAAAKIDLVVGIQGHAREIVQAALPNAHFFDTPEAAGDFVRENARPGDAVLFKGSRGVRVERALERFVA